MTPARTTRPGLSVGPMGHRRFGALLLVVLYKATFCLLLAEASLECGFAPEGPGEAAKHVADAIHRGPGRHDCQQFRARWHPPTGRTPHHRGPAAAGDVEDAGFLVSHPLTRPNGQRPPPAC